MSQFINRSEEIGQEFHRGSSVGAALAARGGYVVERRDQLEVLASPARRELIDTVQVLGACSIVEIAEVLGKPADSLYYHVRKLAQVGLLKQTGLRRGQRREEAIYDVPGRPMRLRLDASDELGADILRGSAAATLRLTERNFRAAIEQGRGTQEGPDRDLLCVRMRRPLTTQERRCVNEHIEAIEEILAKPVEEEALAAEEVHAVTIAMMPIESRPVQRRSGY